MSNLSYIFFMPRRTYEESMQTRERILKAATKSFTQLGYDKVALATLAKEIGLTRGAFYHHFQNKEELFKEVVLLLLKDMGSRILFHAEKGPSGGSDPWESFLLGCRGFLKESLDPSYRRIILIEAPSVLGLIEWQKLDNQYTTSTLVEVLRELKEGKRISISDIHATAQILSGAMNQLSLWIQNIKDLETAQKSLEQILLGLEEN